MKLSPSQELHSSITPTPPDTSLAPPAIPASALISAHSAPKPSANANVAQIPPLTVTDAAQSLDEKAPAQVKTVNTAVLPESEAFASFFGGNNDAGMNVSLPDTNEISFASLASIDSLTVSPPSLQPERVMYPATPKRIDTSFMQPTMVLVPADISAFREQNPKVQITPDQWRVLTCVDGHNSLQMACQLLGLAPDIMCMLAGELVAEGLIYVVPPEQVQIQAPAINAYTPPASGLANGYVAPGYTATSAVPWSAAVPALPSTTGPNPYSALPFETESQWGNGGNGATFVPGRGWITTPQPMLPLNSSGPLASPSSVYAQVGGSRY
jgi:hypothetical protein